MPADWIKMRTDLYRDPKVIGMANALRHGDVTPNVTRYIRCSVVGALVSVWGVLRHQGERRGDDLCIPKCKLTVIDDIADLPGFGEAMASVGWANETPDGVVLPKFFRDLNAEPVRSGAAERQKRYRERQRDGSVTRDAQRDVTQPVTVTGEREGEKRREEKKETPPNPPQAGAKPARQTASKFDPLAVELPHKTAAFSAAWAEWVRHRVEIREALTPTTTAKQLKSLGELPEANAIDCIGRSIANGWTGLFPDNHRGPATKPAGGFKTKAEKDADILAQQMLDAAGYRPTLEDF